MAKFFLSQKINLITAGVGEKLIKDFPFLGGRELDAINYFMAQELTTGVVIDGDCHTPVSPFEGDEEELLWVYPEIKIWATY